MAGKSSINIGLGVFILICTVNLYAEYNINHFLIHISKPMIVGSLMLLFYLNRPQPLPKYYRLILWGLLFSILGDSLLMFVEQNPDKSYLFLMGLGSFLITHIFYLLGFLNYEPAQPNWLNSNAWIALPFLLILAGMLIFLWPGLNGLMKLAVPLYSSVIVAMVIGSFTLKNKIPSSVFLILLAGVSSFMFSDSLIAFNKFRSFQPFGWNPRISIMLTYMIAQLLIVYSWLKISNTTS